MEKEVRQWIIAAENEDLPALRAELTRLFSPAFLPSHDLKHHERVWNNSKQLLLEVAALEQHYLSPSLVSGLMHASWFHDAGMSVDRGPVHGRLGSEMYRAWCNNPVREVAEAIRLHDHKDTLRYAPLGQASQTGILDFLGVADDMDALGVVGIYRFAEIYLHRGIPMDELGIRVLENAHQRFVNLERACGLLPELLQSIRKEFEELRDFFHLYMQQLGTCSCAEKAKEGPLGVVNLIRKLSVLGKTDPVEFFHRPEAAQGGRFLRNYCIALNKALEHERK